MTALLFSFLPPLDRFAGDEPPDAAEEKLDHPTDTDP
jgi:hypothetical protein